MSDLTTQQKKVFALLGKARKEISVLCFQHSPSQYALNAIRTQLESSAEEVKQFIELTKPKPE